MFPILQLGHLAIQTPGLIIIFGLWLGLDLAEKYFRIFGIEPSKGYTLVTIGLLAMIIGGRLAYAAENFSAFTASPVSLISLNITLWDRPGGIILGLTGSIWYGLRHKLISWPLLDSLTPTCAVTMIAIGLSHLASGNAFGEPARLPWSIFLWGEWRHPSQIYETLGASFILLWVLIRSSKLNQLLPSLPAGGNLFLEFTAWSAGFRIFLEMFRGDSTLILGQFRSAQVSAWIILALCLFLLRNKNISAASTSAIPEPPPGK